MKWRLPAPRRQLSHRLALTYGSLLLLVLAAVLLLVSQVQRRIVIEQLQQDLQLGQGVLLRALDQNQHQLSQAAKVLAADYGFREAVASRDAATLLSALQNHRDRINADLGLVATLDGQLLADSRHDQASGAFPFPLLLQTARERGAAGAIVSFDGAVYQLVVVPVKAPLPIAVVAMAFLIDTDVVHDLGNLTGLQVSIVDARVAPDTSGRLPEWQVQASTLSPPLAEALRRQLPAVAGNLPPADQTFWLDDTPYQTLLTPLGEGSSQELAVLQRSLDEALIPHQQLQRYLIGLGLLALVLSLIATVMLSRGIVRPLQQLQGAANRMAAGDYQAATDLHRRDEVGVLAKAFNQMGATIANREQQILTLAYRDPLTDLPNRTYFTEQLQQQLDQQHRVAVLLLDLDRFTLINNTLGHTLGDELLRLAGARLRARMPETAVLARVGADEFAVLLPHADDAAAHLLAEQLSQHLQQPFSTGGQAVDLHASCGYAVAPQDGRDSGTLLRAVDVALYYCRQQRRGILRFDPALRPFRSEHLSLLGDLRRAMQEDQLQLYFQPKVDFQGNDHCHGEVLVRWQHPQRGFIPPIEFIPFAEQTGDIKRLTRWIIPRALDQLQDWQASGLSVTLAVNISAQDLLDDSLADFIGEHLQRRGLPAERLGLEITESGFIDDPERALALLGRLRALNIKLAIDDFGTGYSSLAYLKRLPVQELKIDQTFIRSLQADGEDAAIVRSTIELGHNFGLQVVAEGVETAEQAELLRHWGCDRGQGYLFSRPVPSATFQQWLLQHARPAG